MDRREFLKVGAVSFVAILIGCSSIPTWKKGEVLRSYTGSQVKKELIDVNNDGRYDLVATYFVCNGKPRSKPSSIYDLRNGILYVQRPLVRYSGNQRVRLLPGDGRC